MLVNKTVVITLGNQGDINLLKKRDGFKADFSYMCQRMNQNTENNQKIFA